MNKFHTVCKNCEFYQKEEYCENEPESDCPKYKEAIGDKSPPSMYVDPPVRCGTMMDIYEEKK